MKSSVARSILFSTLLAMSAQSSAWSAALVEQPINPALSQLIRECKKVAWEGAFVGYVSCIDVKKYVLPQGMSMSQLKAFLIDTQEANALIATKDASVAAKAIEKRLNAYLSPKVVSDLVGDTGPWESEAIEGFRAEFRGYQSATAKTVAIMKGMVGRAGNQTFVDGNTQWARGVKASAVWIINPAKKTSYKFTLGDSLLNDN